MTGTVGEWPRKTTSTRGRGRERRLTSDCAQRRPSTAFIAAAAAATDAPAPHSNDSLITPWRRRFRRPLVWVSLFLDGRTTPPPPPPPPPVSLSFSHSLFLWQLVTCRQVSPRTKHCPSDVNRRTAGSGTVVTPLTTIN